MFLTGTQAVLALADPGSLSSEQTPQSITEDVVALSFAGANSDASIVPENELTQRTNYFEGNTTYTDVPSYSQLHVDNLYDGIGVQYYANQQGQLEFDLTVSPGADPSTQRWISQDPLGFDAGDSNLCRYVNNAPTEATDPSGLFGVPPPVGMAKAKEITGDPVGAGQAKNQVIPQGTSAGFAKERFITNIGAGKYSETIKQQMFTPGDCWMVAAAVALVNKGRTPTNGATTLIETRPNSYIVRFPGKGAIEVDDPAYDGKLYGSTGGDGNWLSVLESAAGKYFLDNKGQYRGDLGLNENKQNATPYDMVNNNIRGDLGVMLLTGKAPEVLVFDQKVLKQGIFAVAPTLADFFVPGNKKIMVAASAERGDSESYGIEKGHAYAVLSYTPNPNNLGAGMVELYNPRGSNPFYMKDGKNISRNANGPVFKISLGDFVSAFGGGKGGIIFEK